MERHEYPMILEEIVEKRRQQLEREQSAIPVHEMKVLGLNNKRSCISLYDALKQKRLSVIAEVKRASPSKGLIREHFDPVAIAKTYETSGADAISVLTEETYFQGNSEYLKAIRNQVHLPLLRKDFVLEPYQIYEAKLLGADAILLIAALLDTATLQRFKNIAHGLGLQCLAEVHNKKELDSVLEADFMIVGINNRNLKTFDVNLSTTAELARYIPEQCVIVSESGIAGNNDMRTVHNCGADAVLVGETLMRSDDIKGTLQALRQNV